MIDRYDQDGVAIVRLAHGPVNALDLELLNAIIETFTELEASGHRAIVFTGAGRAFSAGVDLWRIVDGGADYISHYLPALSHAFEAIFRTGKPVVAAVNGHAIAGGCMLATACDYRIMAAGRIGVPELLVGIPFPLTGLEILLDAVGPQRARELVLTGATHEPPAALAHGLVDEVVDPDQLAERALATAIQLASITPPDTYRVTKRMLRQAVLDRLDRRRAEEDPQTLEIWQAKAADGTIRGYMERTVARR